MEKLKNKHDHALTQWLKVIIFGILMLAPFFSVLSRCLYVTCNKNAKDSYSVNGVYKETEMLSSGAFVSGETYTFYYQDNVSLPFNSYTIGFTSLSFNPADYGWSGDIQYNRLSFFYINNTVYIYLYDGENFYSRGNVWGNSLRSFSIVFNGVIANNFTPNSRFAKVYNTIYTFDTLDNAFEYSVNQLTQTPIFNWVQNTAIYTPVEAMTTGLGFDANNNIVALLLTYWAILTAVYVLFDIIISCFVKLTHMVGGSA